VITGVTSHVLQVDGAAHVISWIRSHGGRGGNLDHISSNKDHSSQTACSEPADAKAAGRQDPKSYTRMIYLAPKGDPGTCRINSTYSAAFWPLRTQRTSVLIPDLTSIRHARSCWAVHKHA
jgi:hypothetical protein